MYVPKYFPSSKMCHECGTINSLLELSDREWVCTECGSILDRDKNASLNLRDYFYKVLGNIEISTVGTTGINASGEETSTLR
jgi:putative transposase